MRRRAIVAAIMVLAGRMAAAAEDKPIQDLPKDVQGIAMAWVEPFRSVAEQSRRFDPVSGLWIGLLAGSVKSVERTAEILLRGRESSNPARDAGKIFRYRF
jgi:hypothetical protein